MNVTETVNVGRAKAAIYMKNSVEMRKTCLLFERRKQIMSCQNHLCVLWVER